MDGKEYVEALETTAFTADDDELIKSKALEIWDKIVGTGNIILFQCNRFGFNLVDIVPDPNLHSLLNKLSFVSDILNTMNSYADSFDLSYDDKRLLLNASEHLIIIQKISAAKKADNRADFDKAVEDLSKAAAF